MDFVCVGVSYIMMVLLKCTCDDCVCDVLVDKYGVVVIDVVSLVVGVTGKFSLILCGWLIFLRICVWLCPLDAFFTICGNGETWETVGDSLDEDEDGGDCLLLSSPDGDVMISILSKSFRVCLLTVLDVWDCRENAGWSVVDWLPILSISSVILYLIIFDYIIYISTSSYHDKNEPNETQWRLSDNCNVLLFCAWSVCHCMYADLWW